MHVLVLILSLWLGGEAFAQTWPNEPSGATTIVDCNFSTMLCGYTGSSGGGSIVSDVTAPLSPSSVLQFFLSANCGTCNGGGEVIFDVGNRSKLFQGHWWKPSSPFYGWYTGNNKIAGFFLSSGNAIFDMVGSPGGPYSYALVLQLSGVGNCHLPGFGDCPTGTYTLFANVGSGAVSLGTWNRLEIYFKASTTATSRDGIVRLWVGGTQIMNYTTVNLPGVFTHSWFTPTWDGSWDSGAPQPPTSMSHRYDHIHVSTDTGGGGGGDTTPPPQVTGLAVQPLSTSATITWNAVTDDSGLPVTYEVNRCQGSGCTNFSLINTTQNISTTHSGLTANTTYRWRVRAIDQANPPNLGAYSSIVTATTAPAGASATTVGIASGQFTINGTPTFLLGLSYYDCYHWHDTDLDALATRGFNLLVCHADDIFAGSFTNSLYNSDGSLRTTQQNAIEAFIDYADALGMVVELNCLYADTDGSNSASYLTTAAARTAAVQNCVNAFKANSNVMFSVVTAHNLGAFARAESDSGGLLSTARTACPTCILWYSSSDTDGAVVGDGLSHIFTTQTGSTVSTSTVDAELAQNISLLAPHNNRLSGWHLLGTSRAGNLRSYLNSIGRSSLPLFFEEDAREGDGGTGVAQDYYTYAQNVKLAGAAGWVFNTAAGYDMDPGTAFSQFTATENTVVDNIGAQLSSNLTRDAADFTEACTGTAADIGASWDAGYDGNHTSWQKVSDRCRPTSTSLESLESYNGAADANQWIEVDVPTMTLGAGNYVEVRASLRFAAPATVSGYECRAGKIPSDTIRITRRDAETTTTLASTTTQTLTPPFVFACEIKGSTITALLNGAAVLSASDTTYSSGRPAIYGWSDTAVANVEIDNIEIGGFSVVAPTAPSVTAAVVDSTGATLTFGGSPAFVRVLTGANDGSYTNEVVEPISSFPSGRYTRTWINNPPVVEDFVCFFAQDAQHVENTTTYQCRPTVITVDTTPPVISNPLPTGTLPAGTTSTTISVVTNELATCRYATTDIAYGSMTGTIGLILSNPITHATTVGGLTDNTSFTFYVRCIDQANNETPLSTSVNFSVAAAGGDTTPPPDVTNLQFTILSSTQARFTWTAVVDNVLTDHYNLYRCDLPDCTGVNAIVGTPDGSPFTLGNLTAGQTYFFSIKAVDSSNNESAAFSNIITVTMPLAGDVIPPTSVTTIRAIASVRRRVDVTWSGSKDAESGLAGYILERCSGTNCTNFQSIQFTTKRTYRDTNVSPGATYRYRVIPHDNAGNVATSYSPIATATVPSVPSDTPTSGIGYSPGDNGRNRGSNG